MNRFGAGPSLRTVKAFAPALGQHPAAVWGAAKEGAEFLPASLGPVKVVVRRHPVLATCAVLAIGGLLSARGAGGQLKA